MKADFVVQQPCPSQDGSLTGTIQQIASEQGWARISVAIAYSSVAGVTRLRDLVPSAKVCWIEVGKNTAMGRELEFKSEQARYFGLNPQGGMPEHKTFLVSNGGKVKLRLKYQANSMWRLQFTPEVPEFVAGLRPPAEGGKLGRSPYVAIFRRIKGNEEFKLSFIRVSSGTDRNIRSRSISNGTLGRTTAREYGWY